MMHSLGHMPPSILPVNVCAYMLPCLTKIAWTTSAGQAGIGYLAPIRRRDLISIGLLRLSKTG